MYKNNDKYPNWYKVFAFSQLKKTYDLYQKENKNDDSNFIYDLNAFHDIYEFLKGIDNIENSKIISEISNTYAFQCLYMYFTLKNNSKKAKNREDHEYTSILNLNKALKEFSKCPNVSFKNLNLDLTSYLALGELWECSRINFPENLKIDTITVSGLDRNPQISKAIKWPKNCKVKKIEKIK